MLEKIEIYDWAGACTKHLESVGHSHLEQVTLPRRELYNLVDRLYRMGLNVALLHRESGMITLAVDTRMFGHR
jgi:hypothetical protein